MQLIRLKELFGFYFSSNNGFRCKIGETDQRKSIAPRIGAWFGKNVDLVMAHHGHPMLEGCVETRVFGGKEGELAKN
jgi:hypothetical protein